MNRYRRSISIFIIALAAGSLLACARNAKTDSGSSKKHPDQSDSDKRSSEDDSGFSADFKRRYLTEGFISDNTFRVIIVATKDESTTDPESVRSRAQKRALSSIEKYLRSSEQRMDTNTRARILGLVNASSTFYRKDVGSEQQHVYYLDVTKDNIKAYIRRLAGDRNE